MQDALQMAPECFDMPRSIFACMTFFKPFQRRLCRSRLFAFKCINTERLSMDLSAFRLSSRILFFFSLLLTSVLDQLSICVESMPSLSMTATDLLPKPYIFPQKKKNRPREKFDLRLPKFVRQYSGDRDVQLRSCEYTMQQARKELESKTLDRDVPSHSSNHCSKQKTDEFSCEEVAVNRFREWKPEDESTVFNIRPGRKMFPFLKDVIEAEDKYRKNGSDGDVNIQEQKMLKSEMFKYSVAPSNIVLTRNASSFVCESQDHDQILEVI